MRFFTAFRMTILRFKRNVHTMSFRQSDSDEESHTIPFLGLVHTTSSLVVLIVKIKGKASLPFCSCIGLLYILFIIYSNSYAVYCQKLLFFSCFSQFFFVQIFVDFFNHFCWHFSFDWEHFAFNQFDTVIKNKFCCFCN